MDIIDYLPQKMKAEAEAYMPCGLEEIRVRAGKQVQYMFAGGCRAGVYISHSDIEEMINYLSGYSFHAIAPQLAAGYFTVEDERVIIRTKLEKPSKIKGLALI